LANVGVDAQGAMTGMPACCAGWLKAIAGSTSQGAIMTVAPAAANSAPAVAALVVIGLSALGLPAEPHYAVPVAPAFVLLTGGALLGRRRTSEVLDPSAEFGLSG